MLSSRVVLALVLGAVFVAGGIGGLSYFSSSAPAPRKVIELSVERALNVETDLRTESPSEATAFVRRTWNRRLSVPSLEGATLQGVGRLAVGDQTEVPALLYTDDETGTRIVACAFNYALVDRLGDRLTLAADLRAELAANDAPLAQRHSERAVVLWRQRDDILVLVAPEGDPDRLRARLPF